MKYFTIPNLMTLFRVLIVIPIIYLILSQNNLWAFILIILGILSDADGRVARKLNQTSKFGSYFDLVADGIFIGSLILVLMVLGKLPLVLTLVYMALVVIHFGIFSYVTKIRSGIKGDYLGKITGFLGYLLILLALFDFAYLQIYLIVCCIYVFIVSIKRMIR